MDGSDAIEQDTQEEEQRLVVFGELIVLGYNGANNDTVKSNGLGKKHRSKFELKRRPAGNGIQKATVSNVSVPPRQTQAVLDKSSYTVSYTYGRNHSVIVEYKSDETKDMFQIGRSSEAQIEFTVVDTWLAAGGNLISTPQSGLSDPKSKSKQLTPRSPVSSTISRYACRLLIDRNPPYTCNVYAAGFDASRNIFLGEKATKWQKKNGEVDGLTTNGILILHPSLSDEVKNDEQNIEAVPMYIWREVSVDGDIFTLRETRSAQTRGDLVRQETNELQDGTLIDLCGATLLYRTSFGLLNSPSRVDLELRLDELNAGKPQCPVNLNTLIIPRRRSAQARSGWSPERQPYVYLSCGHVQGKHAWGHKDQGEGTKHVCPICNAESDRILQLSMGMEPSLHLNSDALDHAFTPCGHMASLATVRYWSRIPLPHGTNSFHPVCPFCTTLLAIDKPYLKLIFQDHCDD